MTSAMPERIASTDIEATGDADFTITPAAPYVIGIPDYAALFADWQGSKPTEDGFANSVGRERM